MYKIGIIGAGAWGTALAAVAQRAGRQTVIWAREPEVVAAIGSAHENTPFLPGIALDSNIEATVDMARAADADALLLVVPAQFQRAVSSELAGHLKPGTPVVVCAKGIEQNSGALPTEVLAETLPEAPLAALSGPTFAREVAAGLPTAVTLACPDLELGGRLAESLNHASFRPYISADIIGAQIGGAVKNVLAIGCGIVAGRSMGENARAAVTTRGVAEIMRLGLAKGATQESMMGLSGIGDLMLTCNSEQSRNMSLGAALGRGESLEDILGARTSVAEGVHTAGVLSKVAADLGVDMPICESVHQILNHGASIDETLEALLARPLTTEF